MTLLDKIKFLLLSILTLGIYPAVIFSKKEKQVKNQLSATNKISIDVKKLLILLGSLENIVGTEYTQTKVKVMISDKSLVQLEAIKKLKNVSGIFASRGAITLLVGNQAKALAQKLTEN